MSNTDIGKILNGVIFGVQQVAKYTPGTLTPSLESALVALESARIIYYLEKDAEEREQKAA